MSDNITAQLLICLEVAMLSQEPISSGFVDMWAYPAFPVWSPAFLFFTKRIAGGGESPFFSLPSPALSPLPSAPHHLCRSTNFHLKHVELILPQHKFCFPPFSERPRLQSGRKTQQQNILSSSHRSCVSVFSPFLSAQHFYRLCLQEKSVWHSKHALEGDRKTRGGEVVKTRRRGDHEIKKRDGERARGCRRPSCAKYLTLCVDLPKVRFVLGAYSFSHAGVLLSTPSRRHSHKERGPPSPFPSLLLTPSLKLKFPLPLLPSLFLVHPLHYWNRNATQQERVKRQRETLKRKAGESWWGRGPRLADSKERWKRETMEEKTQVWESGPNKRVER